MTSLATIAALLLAAAAPAQPAAPSPAPAGKASASPGAKPDLSATLPARHSSTETRCAACHSPEGWGDVKFVHERTGFPLEGKHAVVACRKCHVADFNAKLPRNCAGCHRDVHGGLAGIQCASCHDLEGWKSRFDADAHRRTNFPLQGRHALLPCEQCHGDRRDRSFARPTVACWECHQNDLSRAAASGVNHQTMTGYPQLACLGCHSFWSWTPGTFPGHGACFPITTGKHAGIACLKCHVTLPVPLQIGSCTSQPYPSCIRCHSCAKHPAVSGFACVDQRCYGCHYNGSANGTPPPSLMRATPSLRGGKP